MSGAVPQLRFPGFDGGWQHAKLRDLGSFRSGSGFPEVEQGGTSGIPFFKVSDMNLEGNDNVMSIANNYVDSEQVGRMRLKPITTKSIIFAKVGAAIALERKRVAENFLIDNNMMAFMPNAGSINFEYCLVVLRNTALSAFAQVGALPSYNASDLGIIPVPLPTLSEQQKIADFLGTVDAKLDALRRQKSGLEAFKSGLMQRLFSQEIRFTRENGTDFPEWEEETLGNLATIGTGTSNRDSSLEAGDYAFFDRSTDSRWSNRYTHDGEAIIVSGEGKDFPPRYYSGRFDLHQRCYAIMGFGKNSALYLFYWIGSNRAFFLSRAVGSTMPSLRMNAFTDFPVQLPHPDEQRKIADALSALDAKITAVANQIAHIETFKKGLLQQMFV